MAGRRKSPARVGLGVSTARYSREAVLRAYKHRNKTLGHLEDLFGKDLHFPGGLSRLGLVVDDCDTDDPRFVLPPAEEREWQPRPAHGGGGRNYLLYNINRPDGGVCDRYKNGRLMINGPQKGGLAPVDPAPGTRGKFACRLKFCEDRYIHNPKFGQLGYWCYHVDTARVDAGYTRIRDVRTPLFEEPLEREQTIRDVGREPNSSLTKPAKPSAIPQPSSTKHESSERGVDEVRAQQLGHEVDATEPQAPPQPRPQTRPARTPPEVAVQPAERPGNPPPEGTYREVIYMDGARSVITRSVPFSRYRHVLQESRKILERSDSPVQEQKGDESPTPTFLEVQDVVDAVAALEINHDYEMDEVIAKAIPGFGSLQEVEQRRLRKQFSQRIITAQFKNDLRDTHHRSFTSRKDSRKGRGTRYLYMVTAC